MYVAEIHSKKKSIIRKMSILLAAKKKKKKERKKIYMYGKCSQIPYTKVSDKMTYASSAERDWIASDHLHCLPFHKAF